MGVIPWGLSVHRVTLGLFALGWAFWVALAVGAITGHVSYIPK